VRKIKLPRVSIVIPCYKQASLLSDAVGSVVLQECTDWELIIVNDGSPDNTNEVAIDLIRSHPTRFISLINQPNQGLAGARNSGVRAAQGEFILPLDADDLIHPQMLLKCLAAADTDSTIDVVHSDVVCFGATERIDYTGPFDAEALAMNNRLVYCSMYRKTLWESLGGYDTSFQIGYEDWNFWRSAAESGAKAYHLKEFFFMYRVKPESMITTAMKYDTVIRSHMAVRHPKSHTAEELMIAGLINQAFDLLEQSRQSLSLKVFDLVFGSYNEETFPKKLGSLNNLAELIQSKLA